MLIHPLNCIGLYTFEFWNVCLICHSFIYLQFHQNALFIPCEYKWVKYYNENKRQHQAMMTSPFLLLPDAFTHPKKTTQIKRKNIISSPFNMLWDWLYLTQSCRRFPAFVINQSTSAFSYLNISLNQKSDNNFLSSTVVEIPLTRGNSFSWDGLSPRQDIFARFCVNLPTV